MNEFLFLLLLVGIIANIAWAVFLFKKSKIARAAAVGDVTDIDRRVERLMSEVHRVTSANVELLEGRIDALREVGGLADERLKRLRTTLTDLEVLLNRVQRVKRDILEPAADATGDVSESESAPQQSLRALTRAETVQELTRKGLSERQIAQKMNLGVAEVRFLVKMVNPGAPGELRAEEVQSR